MFEDVLLAEVRCRASKHRGIVYEVVQTGVYDLLERFYRPCYHLVVVCPGAIPDGNLSVICKGGMPGSPGAELLLGTLGANGGKFLCRVVQIGEYPLDHLVSIAVGRISVFGSVQVVGKGRIPPPAYSLEQADASHEVCLRLDPVYRLVCGLGYLVDDEVAVVDYLVESGIYVLESPVARRTDEIVRHLVVVRVVREGVASGIQVVGEDVYEYRGLRSLRAAEIHAVYSCNQALCFGRAGCGIVFLHVEHAFLGYVQLSLAGDEKAGRQYGAYEYVTLFHD